MMQLDMWRGQRRQLLGMVLLVVGSTGSATRATPPAFTALFTADLSPNRTVPFPHFWEECVGSSHMMLGTRFDWRSHLKKVRNACGFKRIRGHGLLDNDMNVILSNSHDKCQGCTGHGDLSFIALSNTCAFQYLKGNQWRFCFYRLLV